MDAAMPSQRSSKSASGSGYPELNTTTSRMKLDDIELSPADPNHHEPAMEDVEAALNQRNSVRQKKTLTESEVTEVHRCRKRIFALVVLQGIIIPIVTFIFAFSLAQPGRAVCSDPEDGSSEVRCTVQDEHWSYYLLIPGGASLALVAVFLYRERGPGGALEKSGAPLGCLGITAVPQD